MGRLVDATCAHCARSFQHRNAHRGQRFCSVACVREAEKATPVADLFWSHVDKQPGDGCWAWTGARDRAGYGSFGCDRRPTKTKRAHRVAYAIATGTDPGDLFVCHRCDNPRCVRPEHLFLGTVQDNHDDMRRKGRQPPIPTLTGARHPQAKLTEADVLEIRRRRAAGEGARRLARAFGVTRNTIYRAERWQTWRELGALQLVREVRP